MWMTKRENQKTFQLASYIRTRPTSIANCCTSKPCGRGSRVSNSSSTVPVIPSASCANGPSKPATVCHYGTPTKP